MDVTTSKAPSMEGKASEVEHRETTIQHADEVMHLADNVSYGPTGVKGLTSSPLVFRRRLSCFPGRFLVWL